MRVMEEEKIWTENYALIEKTANKSFAWVNIMCSLDEVITCYLKKTETIVLSYGCNSFFSLTLIQATTRKKR